ncbi:MAG: type II secretion system protein [Phycisphaerae bacterium]
MTHDVDHPRAIHARRAFSLVELVIVVVIIGMISAIAVPRISQASTSAQRNALLATLSTVRRAIDVYFAEHDQYPGYVPGTTTPDGARFVQQLTLYSDAAGATSATYGSPYVYGPYLRAPFPVNPFNDLDTVHVKKTPADPSPALGSVGWVAVLSTGEFGLSVTDGDLGTIDVTGSGTMVKMRGKVGS